MCTFQEAAVFFLCIGHSLRRSGGKHCFNHYRGRQTPVDPSRSRCIGSWPCKPFSGTSANFEFSNFHWGSLASDFFTLDPEVTSKNKSLLVDTPPWTCTAQSLQKTRTMDSSKNWKPKVWVDNIICLGQYHTENKKFDLLCLHFALITTYNCVRCRTHPHSLGSSIYLLNLHPHPFRTQNLSTCHYAYHFRTQKWRQRLFNLSRARTHPHSIRTQSALIVDNTVSLSAVSVPSSICSIAAGSRTVISRRIRSTKSFANKHQSMIFLHA